MSTPKSTLRARQRRENGLCTQCGKPADYGSRCSPCASKGRKHMREKLGFRPWEKGQAGRPLLSATLPTAK